MENEDKADASETIELYKENKKEYKDCNKTVWLESLNYDLQLVENAVISQEKDRCIPPYERYLSYKQIEQADCNNLEEVKMRMENAPAENCKKLEELQAEYEIAKFALSSTRKKLANPGFLFYTHYKEGLKLFKTFNTEIIFSSLDFFQSDETQIISIKFLWFANKTSRMHLIKKYDSHYKKLSKLKYVQPRPQIENEVEVPRSHDSYQDVTDAYLEVLEIIEFIAQGAQSTCIEIEDALFVLPRRCVKLLYSWMSNIVMHLIDIGFYRLLQDIAIRRTRGDRMNYSSRQRGAFR